MNIALTFEIKTRRSQWLRTNRTTINEADQKEQGIKDSKEYLKVILDIMNDRGYSIGNVGIMLEGKQPRILPIEDQLKESIDSLINLGKDKIGITATSGEALSPFGKGLGMQCFCVVTLNKK